jgi:hypothetical protein
MPVGTNCAANTAERITSHDERGGAFEIGMTACLHGHNKVRGRTIDRACLLARLLFAILAFLDLGAELSVSEKSCNAIRFFYLGHLITLFLLITWSLQLLDLNFDLPLGVIESLNGSCDLIVSCPTAQITANCGVHIVSRVCEVRA